MHDTEVFKNTLKEAVETMDVWNAWDWEVIKSLANEKTVGELLELKQTLNGKESIKSLARKIKKEQKAKEENEKN